ncbi:MAG: sensor domain-containing diguanylate cyclase [Nocardioidaceae bacterium]|nr:sensor domain-containing diguanylate cyclase [Nocardioidaceae bacterium]
MHSARPPDDDPARARVVTSGVGAGGVLDAGPHRRGLPVDAAIAQLVSDVVDYAVLILDTGGFVSSWNRGAERIKGYTAEQVLGRHFSVFYPRADVEAGRCDELLATAEVQGRVEHEGWRVRRDGSTFWANVVITALRTDDGHLLGFGKVTRDLTERKLAEEHLRYLAGHDPLSELPNRRAFATALETHLSRASASPGSLLLVDVDHFKAVNDTLGHAAGDSLIRDVAEQLRAHVDDVDGLVARLGGDEFALLLPTGGEERAVATSRALMSGVEARVRRRYASVRPRVSLSIGACVLPGGPVDPTGVLAAADLALYESKRAGRRRWTVTHLGRASAPVL